MNKPWKISISIQSDGAFHFVSQRVRKKISERANMNKTLKQHYVEIHILCDFRPHNSFWVQHNIPGLRLSVRCDWAFCFNYKQDLASLTVLLENVLPKLAQNSE